MPCSRLYSRQAWKPNNARSFAAFRRAICSASKKRDALLMAQIPSKPSSMTLRSLFSSVSARSKAMRASLASHMVQIAAAWPLVLRCGSPCFFFMPKVLVLNLDIWQRLPVKACQPTNRPQALSSCLFKRRCHEPSRQSPQWWLFASESKAPPSARCLTPSKSSCKRSSKRFSMRQPGIVHSGFKGIPR